MQQKQKVNNDVLKELTKVKKRIDKQKEDLRKELNKLENKLTAEQTNKSSGEVFNINDIFNTQTPEEIKHKIAAIKAALALPYYADSEYRKLSIEYLENITKEEAAELENNEKEIEAAKKAIEEIEEQIEQLRKNREDIREAASDKIQDIGLSSVASDMMDFSPEYILNKYKTTCSKYN